MIALGAVPLTAQPTDAWDDSVVDITIQDDLSVTVDGRWQRSVRPWEISYHWGSGVPLHSFLMYWGNLTLERDESGELRGGFSITAAPVSDPSSVDPKLIDALHADGYLSKSNIQRLLTTFYGEDMFIVYGIQLDFGEVPVSSVIHGNYTITTMTVNSSVTSSVGLVRSLRLAFYASINPTYETYGVYYRAVISTDPIPIEKGASRYSMDLGPILVLHPPGTVATIRIDLTGTDFRIIGAHPAANLLLSQYAEIFSLQGEDGEGMMLYLDKIGRSVTFYALVTLSMVLPAAPLLLFLRTRSSARHGGGKERTGRRSLSALLWRRSRS